MLVTKQLVVCVYLCPDWHVIGVTKRLSFGRGLAPFLFCRFQEAGGCWLEKKTEQKQSTAKQGAQGQ